MSYTTKECDACHKLTDEIISYEWMAGKKIKTDYLGTTSSGNLTTSSYKTFYGNITSIPIGFCRECFAKKHNQGKIKGSIVIFLILLAITLPFWGVYVTDMDSSQLSGVLVFIAIGSYVIPNFYFQLTYFGKNFNKFLPTLTKPFAEAKLKNYGVDTLWDQEEYKKIK